MRIIGANIRKIRNRRSLTQMDLSEKAGIHYTFVGHIERGTKLPSLPTLARIAKALDTNLPQLVKGVE